jgi:hypothetical protein
MLGGSVHTLKEYAETLVVVSKETGLEVNAGKTKYMVISRDQNAVRSHSKKMDNSSFETVEELKYLGTPLTNQNSNWEENRNRLNSGNACYNSVQNLLSSSLLSQNLKIKIRVYRNIIFPVVVYVCETWSPTLRKERRLWVFENRVLRRTIGPKRGEVTVGGENYIMRSLMICAPHPILFG